MNTLIKFYDNTSMGISSSSRPVACMVIGRVKQGEYREILDRIEDFFAHQTSYLTTASYAAVDFIQELPFYDFQITCAPELVKNVEFTFSICLNGTRSPEIKIYKDGRLVRPSAQSIAVFKYPDSRTSEPKLRIVHVTARNEDYLEGFEDDQFKRFIVSKIIRVPTETI